MTDMRGCVGPWFGNGLEFATCSANGLHRLQQITVRAGQAIKFPDDEEFAVANLIEHSLELRSIGSASGNLLLEYPPTSCGHCAVHARDRAAHSRRCP